MKKIVLFGDSLCDMSLSLAEKFDVKIIPLGVTFKGDDRTYFDGVDISKDIIFGIDKIILLKIKGSIGGK
jgi:fatty acid-binding protein DegV